MDSTHRKISTIWSVLFGQTACDDNTTFSSLGGNSKLADKLYEQLKTAFSKNLKISPTIAYDYPTIKKQVGYIEQLIAGNNNQKKKSAKKTPISSSKKPWDDAIAIIGMSCRFPAGMDTPQDYWQVLLQGKDILEEVPTSRWNINNYYDPDHKRPGKMNSCRGGFIRDHDCFDAEFFRIAPREAEYMSPNQRLALETSWLALEDACMVPTQLIGSNTGIFMEVMFDDYKTLLEKADLGDESLRYFNTGTSQAAIAGRIAYNLGSQGPAVAIDTACSSSLVAIYEACQHLQTGDCDLALAGGANVILAPEISISFSQANMLSSDGCCKSFSDDANGYVRSEGCAVIVLKRLSDAQQDGNRILAVIKGGAVNQDGASNGFTAPSRLAQQELLEKALATARLAPEDIDYLEAHGTGTPLGDPIELGAIGQVYQGRKRPLYIGSVKSNIGHLEAAAGIAGLMKVVLSLQQEVIPANLYFRAINPRIDLKVIPAQIVVENLAWKKQNEPRRAGISSFGFSGTNAHLIIEEAPLQDPLKFKSALTKTIFKRTRYWASVLDKQKSFPVVNKQDINDWCYEWTWQTYEPLLETSTFTAVDDLIVYDARTQDDAISMYAVEKFLVFIQSLLKNEQFVASKKLIIITEQAYSLHGEPIQLPQACLNGFIKTLILEYPQVNIKQVDVVVKQEIEPLIASVQQDFSREHIMAYREGRWHTARIISVKKEELNEPITFNADATYLITGGLGGIGLSLAYYLSEFTVGRIILVSRRSANATHQKIIDQITTKRGVLPMMFFEDKRHLTPRTYCIGTAAGLMRPSSTYAYLNIQRYNAALAKIIANNDFVTIPPLFTKEALYTDHLFLTRWHENPEEFGHTAVQNFTDIPIDSMVRYLMDNMTKNDFAKIAAAYKRQ